MNKRLNESGIGRINRMQEIIMKKLASKKPANKAG